jgi:RNA polymerase sigma-70 factor (ECF subfamily)
MELPIQEPRDEAELATLVKQASAGNEAAFEQLARRVRARVRRWAGRLTHDDDDAEDITQLVLVRLHERIREFEGRSRFTSWLYRVTRNVALVHRRVVERRKTILTPMRTAGAQESTGDTHDIDADAARIGRLVRAYFAELPERQREVFEMADLRGRTSAEIAAQLRIAPATVRVLLFKARRTIRLRMLAEHPRLLKEYLS